MRRFRGIAITEVDELPFDRDVREPFSPLRNPTNTLEAR